MLLKKLDIRWISKFKSGVKFFYNTNSEIIYTVCDWDNKGEVLLNYRDRGFMVKCKSNMSSWGITMVIYARYRDFKNCIVFVC